MQTQKPNKIDLNADYPCPCRRRGQLIPITLTEAFGCSRCQQIFVIQDSGYAIEQLSTTYPYKKAWRWTGQQWSIAQSSLGRSYLPLALLVLVGLVIVLLIATINQDSGGGSSTDFHLIAALVLTALLVFIFWLACRR